MMKALINSDGKLLITGGKVATDDCDGGCCIPPGGCCLPRDFDGTWQSRDASFQNCSDEPTQEACESLGGTFWTAFFDPNTNPPPVCDDPFGGLTQFLLCCDSTSGLDITNCFNQVDITATLNFSADGSPEGCTPNSGTMSLSQSFSRIPFDPFNVAPAYPNFYIITRDSACDWGVIGPEGGSFFVGDDDMNDEVCATPGEAAFQVGVNLASNFMSAQFTAVAACGDSACAFTPGSGIGIGEFAFDTCTLGTYTFTASDSNDDWSYDITVSVTLA